MRGAGKAAKPGTGKAAGLGAGHGRRAWRWLVGYGWQPPGLLALLLALLALAGPHRALAQTAADSIGVIQADTSAAPVVAPAAGGAGGVPSSEFETYTVNDSGTRYTATLTGIYSAGTVQRVYLTTSHTGNFKLSPHWLLPAAFNFSYGKQDGLLRERELLALLTPTYQQGRVKYYLLADGERSNLRAIANRLVGGLGAGYTLYADTARNELSVSEFFLYEHTEYLNELRREVPRSSTRLKARLSKGPVLLAGQLFYQPSLRDFRGDYRLNIASSLSFTVSRHLALTAALAYSYESIAVENRAPGNTNVSVGFTYTTGK